MPNARLLLCSLALIPFTLFAEEATDVTTEPLKVALPAAPPRAQMVDEVSGDVLKIPREREEIARLQIYLD